MRAYPNLHPLVARHLGIRMMYAPPLRPAHSMVTPIRPLVVRCTHNFAGAMLFSTRIRDNVSLAEAPSNGQDVFSYKRGSYGAKDYAAFAAEFLERTEGCYGTRG